MRKLSKSNPESWRDFQDNLHPRRPYLRAAATMCEVLLMAALAVVVGLGVCG